MSCLSRISRQSRLTVGRVTAAVIAGAVLAAAGTAKAQGGSDVSIPLPPKIILGSTGAPDLSGKIVYYQGDRPVPAVTVDLLGSPPQSTLTDTNGDYSFGVVAGTTTTLRPSKLGGSNNGITSDDASQILQRQVGLVSFDALQSLACDVTGNGTITSLDAARILQYQVALISRFPVAEACGSDWLFLPNATPADNQTPMDPQISSGTCQPGAIGYDPLVPPAAGQGFTAILFGDCTGNWTP